MSKKKKSPKKPRSKWAQIDPEQTPYLPTPDEIKEACKEIQKDWTPEEFYKRARQQLPDERNRWDVPEVDGEGLGDS